MPICQLVISGQQICHLHRSASDNPPRHIYCFFCISPWWLRPGSNNRFMSLSWSLWLESIPSSFITLQILHENFLHFITSTLLKLLKLTFLPLASLYLWSSSLLPPPPSTSYIHNPQIVAKNYLWFFVLCGGSPQWISTKS